MTGKQADAVLRLAKRVKSDLDSTSVVPDPSGRPQGWVRVTVMPRGHHPSSWAVPRLVADVCPEGYAHP